MRKRKKKINRREGEEERTEGIKTGRKRIEWTIKERMIIYKKKTNRIMERKNLKGMGKNKIEWKIIKEVKKK